MEHRDFIVHIERVTLKKVNYDTVNFSVMATINDRPSTISHDITNLSQPIESENEERQTYTACMETITVEKGQPLMLQINCLDIQNQPHVRIRYMEFEGQERIKTYLLTSEDGQYNYKVHLIEDRHENN